MRNNKGLNLPLFPPFPLTSKDNWNSIHQIPERSTELREILQNFMLNPTEGRKYCTYSSKKSVGIPYRRNSMDTIYLGNAQRIIEAFYATLYRQWRHFGTCPNEAETSCLSDVFIGYVKMKNQREKASQPIMYARINEACCATALHVSPNTRHFLTISSKCCI